MAKISVRHGVARGYGFLLGRPLSVIGLTWLPAVFYAVAASFLIQHMSSAIAAAVPSSGGLLGQYAFFYFLALLAATALFGAMIAVPLTRDALGLREERVAVHLVVGGREFRLFLALMRYYALMVVAFVVLAIGAGVAISQGAHYAVAHGIAPIWQGLPLETWLNSAAGALAVILFGVFAVRYGFLLDAISAVEEHARLSRASALSRGSFWKIATITLIVCLPAALVVVAFELTFGGIGATGRAYLPADAGSFASILAVGLVVLHTLLAGASAGAYSELAENAATEVEVPADAFSGGFRQPAMAFADSGAETMKSILHQPLGTPRYEPSPAAIVAETPEAEGAFAQAAISIDPAIAPSLQIAADFRDAHSRPEGSATSAEELQESHPIAEVEPVEAEAPAGVEAEAIASNVEVPHAGSVEAEALPVHVSGEIQSIALDAHSGTETAQDVELSSPADAEFPSPPLDVAGAIAAQPENHPAV